MSLFSPNQLPLFQALVDGGLALLFLLHRLDRPATAQELARLCGISPHTALRHLHKLQDFALVEHLGHHQGFVLQERAREILFSEIDVNFNHQPITTIKPISNQNKPSLTAVEVVIDPNSAGEDCETGSVETSIPALPLGWQKIPKNGRKSRRKSGRGRLHAQPEMPEQDHSRVANLELHPPPDPATLNALRSQGIGEPKRSQLGRLPHMNPEFVQAWAEHFQANRPRQYTPGLLIHVLELGEPPPEPAADQHPPDCGCVECIGGGYICGECFQYPCACPEASEAQVG